MKRVIQLLHRDERGNVLIIVGGALAVIMLFAVMAIDMGQMTLVRTQLQNAADAAALSGALEYTLTGSADSAISSATVAAAANVALVQDGDHNVMGAVDISPSDVEFPGSRVVRVTTHRTADAGDNFLNYFMRIFAEDGEVGEMTATAAAGFDWICGGKCLKPWAPPDRWHDEDGDGLFDSTQGDYYDPITTGYTDADLGEQITLVLGDGSKDDFGAFWYYSITFPPLNKGNPETGGNDYRNKICDDCHDGESFTVEPGDTVVVEPGGMKGPNKQGLECLIAQDPDAEWDAATGTVINSAYTTSPRITKAVLFDPSKGLFKPGGRAALEVVKVMVIFVEEADNQAQITGRFMRLAEPEGVACEDQTNPSFLYKASLIE